jgi:hypothetical protein
MDMCLSNYDLCMIGNLNIITIQVKWGPEYNMLAIYFCFRNLQAPSFLIARLGLRWHLCMLCFTASTEEGVSVFIARSTSLTEPICMSSLNLIHKTFYFRLSLIFCPFSKVWFYLVWRCPFRYGTTGEYHIIFNGSVVNNCIILHKENIITSYRSRFLYGNK